MKINALGNSVPTLLDYLSTDTSDESISALLQQNAANNLEALRTKLGLTDSSSATATYDKILTASENTVDLLKDLVSTDQDSLFAKAAESKDTTEVVSSITNLVASYNSMVTSMSSVGGTANITYLAELGKAFVDNEDALKAVGITRNDNGTLTIDAEKLQAASLDDLKALFNDEADYVNQLGTNIVEISNVALQSSLMSARYSNAYGSDGTTTTNSLLNSLYNSQA